MGHDPQLREVESSRLDSWKEIASFLHRDARTVRRWERERRLPVHRVPGGERSGVFAYVNELESWLHAASPGPERDVVAHSEKTIPADGNMQAAAEDKLELDTSLVIDGSEVGADPEIQSGGPLSALQSLNQLENNFAADAISEHEKFVSPAPSMRPRAQASSHMRQYQVLALFLLLTAAIGISAGVVHYRETRQVKKVAYVPTAEAQELYLRGRYDWNLRTEDGLNSAVDLFTQSIVNDPHYAAAYAGLADSYLLLRQYANMPDSEAYPRALAAAKQAIALDDASPDAHRSIAFILRFWNWDMVAAEREYRRAIELNPNDSLSHHWYATALLASNRNREALAEIDIARRLEPQSVSVLADRGLILSEMDAPAGVKALKLVEAAQPNFYSTHVYLAEAYLKMENYAEFLDERRLAANLSQDKVLIAILESARKTLAARGPGPMLRQIAKDSAPLADRGAVPAYATARLFALAGDSGQAMRYLRLACDRREPGFLSVEDDQAFKVLRSSGEYNTLISRRDVSLGTRQPIARLNTPQLSE